MNWFKYCFIFLIVTSFSLQARVQISSNPDDSSIYVVNPETSERFSVGTTPYEGSLQELLSRTGDDNTLFLHIEKTGFETYRLLLNSFGRSSLNLNVNLEVAKDIKIVQDLDLLVNDLFDVQRMARGRDFSSALSKLDLLEERFPHYSVIHEMRGSIFYLQQEYTRSLSSYRRAFSLNAENRDAYRMKVYLERRFGVSEGGAN